MPATTPLAFRLGLYDQATPDDVEFFGPVFEPCRVDTLAMKMVLDRFSSKNEPAIRIGIYIVEAPAETFGGAA